MSRSKELILLAQRIRALSQTGFGLFIKRVRYGTL